VILCTKTPATGTNFKVRALDPNTPRRGKRRWALLKGFIGGTNWIIGGDRLRPQKKLKM